MEGVGVVQHEAGRPSRAGAHSGVRPEPEAEELLTQENVGSLDLSRAGLGVRL